MSDTWLCFIPTDPTAQPSPEATANGVALLRSFAPDAERVTAEVFAQTQFFNAGANLTDIACSARGTDAHDWRGDAMAIAHASGFENLMVTTPCCGVTLSLNALYYDAPAGFARFVLKAMNPGLADISRDQHAALELRLGLSLRRFVRRL